MKTTLLTLIALVAFAANSILNRAALIGDLADPYSFMGLRFLSGAIMLAVLVSYKNGPRHLIGAGDWVSAGALLLYGIAFSVAYTRLEAGLGALILFGGVQVTMFSGALLAGQRPAAMRWAGSALGMAGLLFLFKPSGVAPDPLSAVLMLAAAFGWGLYSLRGQKALNPTITTAGNFLRAAPFGVAMWLAFGTDITLSGAGLAILSGAIASAIGYAIWYSVLPVIDATLAAVAQLTVPIIALGGGILFLGEEFTTTFLIASLLIQGGVVLAVLSPAQSR